MKDMYIAVDEETYLKHYGVAGMKWGVRRYQNPDGSFTREGKLRYTDYAEKKAIKAIKRREKKINRAINAAGIATYTLLGGKKSGVLKQIVAPKTVKVKGKLDTFKSAANLLAGKDYVAKDTMKKVGGFALTSTNIAGAIWSGARLVNSMVANNAIMKTTMGSIDARTGIVVND